LLAIDPLTGDGVLPVLPAAAARALGREARTHSERRLYWTDVPSRADNDPPRPDSILADTHPANLDIVRDEKVQAAGPMPRMSRACTPAEYRSPVRGHHDSLHRRVRRSEAVHFGAEVWNQAHDGKA